MAALLGGRSWYAAPGIATELMTTKLYPSLALAALLALAGGCGDKSAPAPSKPLPIVPPMVAPPTTPAAVAPSGDIHDAVMKRDLDKIKSLLKANPKLVNEPNEAGDPPLYIAIYRSDRALVDLILTNKADVNPPPNKRGETPLSIAVELGYKVIAQMLRKAGAKETDASFGAAIRHAASRRDKDELPKLLAAHRQLVDARDGLGNTALYLAAFTDSADVVPVLLAAKADPNATNRAGGTPYSIALERDRVVIAELLRKAGGKENRITDGLPIRQAARKGDVEKVRELVQARPELVAVRDDLDRSPLHEAALIGSTSVVEFLLERKAEVDARDFSRSTPLLLAAGAGQKGVVELLLAHQADVNARSKQDTTALIAAALRGHTNVLQLLLDQRADLALADNLGFTALHWAAMNGHTAAAKLLLARQAPFDGPDRRGNTPLHIAASRGRKDICVALLEAKAELNGRNKEGFTPLKLALRSEQKEVAELLRERGGKE